MSLNDKLQCLDDAGYTLIERIYPTCIDRHITSFNEATSIRDAIIQHPYLPEDYAQTTTVNHDYYETEFVLKDKLTDNEIVFPCDELDRLESTIDLIIRDLV